ncbi:MAG: hypothetical protein F4Y26_00490 [Gammaproteobacteria bacterium]|nr:hypothetical protein [Gammaproteobacteria bacterium]
MTIHDHGQLLQALHRTVEGDLWAPTKYPSSINKTPAVLTVPGPATHYAETNDRGDRYTPREYYAHLYYTPIAKGMTWHNLEGVYELAETIVAKYHAAAQDQDNCDSGLLRYIGGTEITLPADYDTNYPYIMYDEENPIGDDGLEPIGYSGKTYVGFTFTVRIMDATEI